MKARLTISALTGAMVFLLASARSGYAIGEFSAGILAGFTHAPNNIDEDIARYNNRIRAYSAVNLGAQSRQMAVPYSPAIGMSLRYQFNYLLLRLGLHYTKPLGLVHGSVTPPGGLKNSIRMRTSQSSMPASIAFLIPLKKRTHFYIGAGGTLYQAHVRISQSFPEQASPLFSMTNLSLSNNAVNSYARIFPGFHLLAGIEIPLGEKLTASAEWIHQEGQSYPDTNNGKDYLGSRAYTPRKALDARGDFLLIGINYYFRI